MSDPIIIVTLLAIVAVIGLVVNASNAARDRRSFQEKLAAAEKRFEANLQLIRNERDGLLDTLTDVFLIIDDAHLVSYANAAAHRLFGSRKLIDRHIREASLDPRLSKALQECLNSKGPHQTQITLPPQGSSEQNQGPRTTQSWMIDSAPMTTHDGVSPATRIVMRNITKEQQTEQIRQDFVANASHELRTPMAIIKGYLENLLDDDLLADEESARKFLGIMRKHSDRMTRIIEDMLVISRLESGEESSLNIAPFKLKDCVQDILERLESLIRSQQATVELNFSDDALEITGDRFYWTQALFNLIENALKQNPRPGLRVEIGCRVLDGQIQIWVSDDGIGIPNADLPFIFRRFYRVNKQQSQSEIKGTGLGLSIVKRAIEAHQGTIEASSIPGTETKFLMTMPLQGPPKQEG